MKQYAWAKSPPPFPEDKIARRIRTDIAVIGAGHAGTCAARAAAEAGAAVVVVEQQPDRHQRILGIGELG